MATKAKPAVAKAAAAKAAARKPAAKSPAAKSPKPAGKLKSARKPATLAGKVSAKRRANVSAALNITRDVSFRVIDAQRAVWLAGLGALAKANVAAGSKGEKAFEMLVKAGEALESQARVAIDSGADKLKAKIGSVTGTVDANVNRLGDAFDTRVEEALARIGFPKAETMKQLVERLTELSKSLEGRVRQSLAR